LHVCKKGNIYKGPRMFAVLDEGCNRTCHGQKFSVNAEAKLRNMGKTMGIIFEIVRTMRTMPIALRLLDGTSIGWELASDELDMEDAPLLISLSAQAILGFWKDPRTG